MHNFFSFFEMGDGVTHDIFFYVAFIKSVNESDSMNKPYLYRYSKLLQF